MLDRPHPSPRTCAREAGRFAGHAFSRAHWLLPVTSRSDIKGAGAGFRGAVQELEVEGAWEGTPGRPAAGVSAMFYSGLLTEGGRKETDMREAASLRQQRRMKQAVQFIHKDSADLLPLDGLKKLGSSKDTVSSPPSAMPVTGLWAATGVQALTATFTESPARLVAVRSLAGAGKPLPIAQPKMLSLPGLPWYSLLSPDSSSLSKEERDPTYPIALKSPLHWLIQNLEFGSWSWSLVTKSWLPLPPHRLRACVASYVSQTKVTLIVGD